ncbi:MAG: leucine-rich repeat protein [Clostridia bacterium]|nr:leucine-rich repeat protein [Clostridia bacterium]
MIHGTVRRQEISSQEYIVDGTTLREYVGTSPAVHIPEGITAIASGAFRDRKQQIEEVIVPEGVRELRPHTFARCRSLHKVVLPSSLQSIGPGAFQDCENLPSIEIPPQVKRLRSNTFDGCQALWNIKLPDAMMEIEDGSFRNCRSLRSIHLPEKLVSIGTTAAAGGVFAGSGLEALRIPDGVEVIGSCAFQNCRSLRRAELPPRLRQIGAGAFSGCRHLAGVRIPATVSSIGSAAFSGCSHPEEIALPPELEKMRQHAGLGFSGVFHGCRVENGIMTGCDPHLSRVCIPAGVTTIGAGAFNGLADDLALHPRRVEVMLPQALRVFERSRLQDGDLLQFVFPPEFLRQTQPLPMPFTQTLIDRGHLPVSLLDAAHLFLFQETELSQYAARLLSSRSEQGCRAMYRVLQRRRSTRALLRAARFAERHSGVVSTEVLEALYRLALAGGSGAAALQLSQAAEGAAGAERFCREQYDAEQVDSILREAGLNPDSSVLGKVRLRNGTPASAHLVKCMLKPYLARDPRLVRVRDPQYSRQRIDPESQQLEKAVDRESLQAVLDDLFPEDQLYANPQWFPAYCRFAGSLQISAYDRHIRELFADNELLRRHACTALTLSDTREAACRSAEYACGGRFGTLFGYWCHIRGRGMPVVDGAMRVHLDSDGTRTFAFPERTLQVRLGDELSLQVWDRERNIMLGGPDTWGIGMAADALSADIDEMKSRLAAFLKTERSVLLQLYISGRDLTLPSWKRLYLQDPVRRREAAGLVWTQGPGRSFRVAEGKLHRWDGMEYVPTAGSGVRLAHLLEMTDAERQAWREIPAGETAVNQLGERLRAGRVAADHYNGLTITAADKESFERIFGSQDSDWQRLSAGGHGSFAISCRPVPPANGQEAALRLGSFCLHRCDRAANLALNVLDDMIIRGRIREDDPQAVALIEEAGCSGREIRGYLDLAIETGALKLSAALLSLGSRELPEAGSLYLS